METRNQVPPGSGSPYSTIIPRNPCDSANGNGGISRSRQLSPVRIFYILPIVAEICQWTMENGTSTGVPAAGSGVTAPYYYWFSGKTFGNGQWRQGRSSWCAESQLRWDYAGEGFGNGQWRRTSLTASQPSGAGLILICQLGEGQWAMEPMERATIPGKIYSKLPSRVVAIIKFLPPFKLWV